MITVKSSLELSGEFIKFTVESGRVSPLEIHVPANLGAISIASAMEYIRKVRDELTQALETLEAYGEDKPIKQLTFEPMDVVTIFKGIEAKTSNEARAIAYRLFYADAANKDLVLHIKSCPPIGEMPDGKREYDVMGFTKPRQKKLKATLAPVEKKEEAA